MPFSTTDSATGHTYEPCDALAAVGKATDNEQLEAEGRGDQTTAQVKKTGEDVKDVFR